MNTLFSIIVPVYNCERFLTRCFESIRNQACQKYEVILVDDGSTDSSGEICDKYANSYGQFSVIHKKNGGLSSARNCGLSVAKGKYILFLDADDYIEKELVSKVYYYLEEKGYDACSYCVRRVDENNNYIYEMKFGNKYQEYSFTDDNREQFLVNEFLQYDFGWEVCFYAFRRSILKEYQIMFSEDIQYAEDIPFVFHYLLHAKKFIKIPDILYNYTWRNNSATSTVDNTLFNKSIFSDVFNEMMKAPAISSDRYDIYFASLLKYYYSILTDESNKVGFVAYLDNSGNSKYFEHIKRRRKEMEYIFGKNEVQNILNFSNK